jgi:hypothetical protein
MKYQLASVPRVRLSKRQVEALRTLIKHALEDLDYGVGGTYVLAGSNSTKMREGEVTKAKEAIRFLSLMIENRDIL